MTIKDYIQLVQLNELFKYFTKDELLTFFCKSNYSLNEYGRDNIIHFESEKCNTLDIILEGEVIIQKIDEKGNALTVTEFHAGQTIGGNLIFSHLPFYPMSVISREKTIMLHIKKELVLHLCQSNKHFLLAFLQSISDKTTILTNKIKAITMKTIREAIIDFLTYEYYVQNSKKIHLGMTKKELAERLGIQRTSLSRELNKMKKDGLVDYDANSINILDLSMIR